VKKELREFKVYWIEYFSKKLKSFPDDFLGDFQVRTLKMPSKNLLPGNIFFGKFEITDSDSVVHFKVDDRYEYKYIIYASRNKPDEILIPVNQNDIKQTVIEYENFIRSILKEMKSRYQAKFNTLVNFNGLATGILKFYNIQLF